MTSSQSETEQLNHWRAIFLAKIGSSETTPFGDGVLVYKVCGKMFALLRCTDALSVNLKCDPQEALILRDSFAEVTPGYHMNKKHWNTIDLMTELDRYLIQDWIDDSYDLVVQGLSKKDQAALKAN